jgi:hypothetical protein
MSLVAPLRKRSQKARIGLARAAYKHAVTNPSRVEISRGDHPSLPVLQRHLVAELAVVPGDAVDQLEILAARVRPTMDLFELSRDQPAATILRVRPYQLGLTAAQLDLTVVDAMGDQTQARGDPARLQGWLPSISSRVQAAA